MKSASRFLKSAWTDSKEWHDISWVNDGTQLIGQMSSSIFVGDHLASNIEWQKTSISYAVNMFQGARTLRTWPAWTRPFIHWFISECKVCQSEVKKADNLIQAELKRRSKTEERYDDTITWIHQTAKGRPYNASANQLGLSMAAVITTSELLKQCLIEYGWTGAALAQMQYMDSFIKETQRLNPLSEVNLERKVVRTTTLPNGQILPAGTNISVHTASFLDPSIYPNPTVFDGARFLKLRQAGGKWESAASAVSTSAEHFVFGLGRFICPGRFIAIAEVKIALAVILGEYDVRFAEGYVPKAVRYGFEILGDPEAKLQVKKRIF
ncbi:hypothetical protein E8E13_000305 [Curvularia kusanoi]|uniref:Cytochrome P450 n=1 Tax=Curvularia kusanoi TaxID=90978 RepID=A0A9P4THV1_CURKU|nr:hypothetical protein E8E13_000305 [Curvularia kusanoi]